MAVETPTKRQEKEGKIIEMCHECNSPIEIPIGTHEEIANAQESFVPVQYAGCNRLFLKCGDKYYCDISCYNS